MGLTLRLGPDYLDGLQADLVFRTPGMHPQTPALCRLRESGAEITSEMEIFFSCCPCPIIAVTGSRRKNHHHHADRGDAPGRRPHRLAGRQHR